MAAPKSTVKDVKKDMEAITSGLTRTVLGDDAVNTHLAVKTSTKIDDMDAIANRLGETVLQEGGEQSHANLPAAKGKATEKHNQEKGLDSTGVAKKQAAGKGEEGIDALGAAWSSLSLENADELEDHREAQRLREHIQKEHEDKMRALKNAEAKRQADEEFGAFMRQFQADIDGAKLKKMQRKARKEKNEEAARQLRLAAEAESIFLAERRAQQERRLEEEAQAAQAKRESDERARLELSQIYERIFADAAIAHNNAQEAQRQQQRHEAELIAQYHAVVARQVQQQEELFLQQQLTQQQLAQQQLAQQQLAQQQLAQQQLAQQQLVEQQLVQQQYTYPQGEQVSEGAEEMDTAPEWRDLEVTEVEGTEMDTAQDIEASGGTAMEWVQMEEKMPLPAEPLLPQPQPMALQTPSTSESSAPAEEISSSGTPLEVDNLVFRSQAGSSQVAEERPAMPAADEKGTTSHASTVADTITAPKSAVGPNTANSNSQPADPASARPIEANVATAATAVPAGAAEPAEAEPPAPASAPAIAPPPAPASRIPTCAATPPPPPAPMPAPIPSSPKPIKIVVKRGIPNPKLAALRPTISAWAPLGRLLSQQKSISQVALPQVLGKRGRQDWEDGGRHRKQTKLEGEFQFEVGGKRKREDETFPGKKRTLCNRRALVVPCSRLAASPSIASPNNAAPPPTLNPTSTPPNVLLAPTPSSPPQPPPPSATLPLPINSHRGLAEATDFFNDLPKLRAEIAWMRAQRLNTSRKKTQGKDVPSHRTTATRISTPASYWLRYRENFSR